MKTSLKHIVCVCAAIALIAGCSSTSNVTSSVSNKETLLANAGFKQMTVTTAKQKSQVEKLEMGKVSAVMYQGKLYYVYPTATKDRIYFGKQKQFDAYKSALMAQRAQKPMAPAAGPSQPTNAQAMAAADAPVYQWETAGPHHIVVKEFDGFAPISDSGD